MRLDVPDVVGTAALAGGSATNSDESEQRGPEAAHRKGCWPDAIAATSTEEEKDAQATADGHQHRKERVPAHQRDGHWQRRARKRFTRKYGGLLQRKDIPGERG